MKKIDLDSLYNSKSNSDKDCEVKVTYINVYSESDGIVYQENDLRSGICKYIQGNKTDGFKELIFSKKDEFAIREEYWANRNIKHFEKIYFGGLFTSKEQGRLFETGFPVEYSDSYDTTGKLSKRVNNEEFFLFTLKDVKRYLENKGLDFSNEHKSAVIKRDIFEGHAIWYLSYYDYSQRLIVHIQLSGSDGKELSITKTRMFQGNIDDIFPADRKQNPSK